MLGGIKCQNCGKEVSEDEVFATDGKTLCEIATSTSATESVFVTPGGEIKDDLPEEPRTGRD